MVKYKSFDISDSEGLNKLYQDNIMAKGAHILLSDGKLMAPYEDGLEPSNHHRILRLQELRNQMEESLEPLVQSESVNILTLEGIAKQLEELEKSLDTTPSSKEKYKKNKEAELEMKRLVSLSQQTKNQSLLNLSEITRIKTNLEVYDKRIAKLELEA